MLLRRSGASQDQDYNLSGLTAGQATIGVESEEVLLAIAAAVVGFDHDSIAELVNNHPAIDRQFISDAVAVASGFNGITKIANATGLPLDDTTDAQTVQMREDTGINKYSEKIKKKEYG